MPVDRAVRKYIAGIKKNNLYVVDSKGMFTIMATKGTNPQDYEKFLLNFVKNNYSVNGKRNYVFCRA